MLKPVRVVLAGCALLRAVSISASTVFAAKPSGNPAGVKFTVAPKKFVCLNDFVPMPPQMRNIMKRDCDIPLGADKNLGNRFL